MKHGYYIQVSVSVKQSVHTVSHNYSSVNGSLIPRDVTTWVTEPLWQVIYADPVQYKWTDYFISIL